jgi:hypothetical protein
MIMPDRTIASPARRGRSRGVPRMTRAVRAATGGTGAPR